jgi:acyl-CoA thioester hydrolase
MPEFSITRRVEFGDTDMAGIMHFSNFFRFMEVAETAFLRARGMSVSWDADGVHHGFPRVAASCDYHSPAKFEQELTITVTLEKLGHKSVSYRFDFTHESRRIATGRMTAVYCRATGNQAMESLEIPAQIRQQLEASRTPS